MKNAKRFIASLTAAAAMGSCSFTPLAVAGIVPELPALTAEAAETLTYGDFSYTVNTVNESDEVTLTKYSGSDTEIDIPSEIDGNPVTTIGMNLFDGKKKITKITIPKTIKTISSYAFRNTAITEFTFHEGLETIGFAAFDGTSVSEVSLPKSLKDCPGGLRQNALVKATFADGIEIIPDQCFDGADNLGDITIPESVNTIGSYAFRNCKALKEFKFHEGIETIGFAAFDGTSVSEVSLPKSLKACSGGIRQNALVKATFADGIETIPDNCFDGADNLGDITIPESVKTIGSYAFRNCKALKEFKFHEGIETIGFAAFDGTSVSEVSLPKSLKDCHGGIRQNALTKVTFADGIETIPDNCFDGASNLADVTIPESVKTIGSYAFRNCKALKEFKFHEGLESIGFATFDGTSVSEVYLPKSLKDCSAGLRQKALTKVTFADGIETIPDQCFDGADNLSKVILPDSVKTIGSYAFRNCKALKEFTFHEGIETIGSYSFDGTSIVDITLPSTLKSCTEGLRTATLKKVTFAEGIEAVPERCFDAASGLSEVVLPASVKEIGAYAFRSCRSLKEFKFHEGIESIGNAAFFGTSLSDITLPSTLKTASEVFRSNTLKKVTFADGIETIPTRCLDSANSVEEVVFPDSVKTIDSYAFRNTTALRSITLPGNLESIGSDAFRGSGIRSLVIPDSVTQTGTDVFADCKHLKNVTVGTGLTKLNTYIFGNCTELEKVTLPDNLESIGGQTFSGCRKLSEVELDAISYKVDNTSFRKCFSLKDTRFVHLSRPESEIKASMTKAAVGNKVDFTVDFDCLDEYTENKKKFTLYLTVPKELTIDPESVKAASGTLIEENAISSDYKTIAFETESGSLTFSAIATEAGDYDIDAELRFTHRNWSDYYAPLGSVRLSVKELTLSAPEVMNELKTDLSGTGPKGEKVEVYMNDKLIASPVCNEVNGKFTMPFELPKGTKDGDTFTVYAKYGDISTDPQEITYSPEKSAISDVRIRVNNTGDVDITDVFTSCYSPVMTLLPEHRMKFTINITNSALLSKVYVTSNKEGTIKRMEAQYDSKNDVWVAEGNFGSNSYVPGYLNFVLVTKEDAKSGEETDFTEGYFSRDGYIRFIIDPSGVVYEGAPSNPVAGAEMTLYTVDENDKLIKWDPTDYDQQNPLLTNEEGEYSWDVPEGEWKVMCSAEGYEPAESVWFEVPPAKTDIDFGLISSDPGEVTDITYDNDVITLNFSKYMDPDSITESTVSVEGLGEYTVDPLANRSGEEYTDKFRITGNYDEAVDVTVKVGLGCRTYAGVENTKEMEKTFHINDPVVTTTEAVEEPTQDTVTTAAPGTTPVETKPVTTDKSTKPAETKPATTDKSTKPVETKPVTTTEKAKPVTTTAPVETKPVTTEPVTEVPTEAPTEEPKEPATEAPTEEPTDAPADVKTGKCGDSVTWSFDPSTGVLTISGTGKTYDYEPFNIGSVPTWSPYKNDITSVVIEEGVTYIGAQIFYDLNAVKTFTFPAGLDMVAGGAFNETPWVTKQIEENPIFIINNNLYFFTGEGDVVIPDGVKHICYNSMDRRITSVVIPDSVTVIDYCAFAYAPIKAVTISEGVQMLDERAFDSCENLEEVTIPASVTSIGKRAFDQCGKLGSITILNPECEIFDEGTTICSEWVMDDDYYDIAGTKFAGVIRGFKGSTAESYANKYGYTFEEISAEPEKSLGDINGDGMIDSNDASVVLEDYARASTGGESEIDKAVGDINNDGTVDSNDASIILAYYAAVSTGKDIKLEDFIAE